MPNPSAPVASPCTCFRVRKLSRLMSRRYDQRLAAAGLNLNQYSILRRVGDRARAIGELAAELGMDRSTLSRDLKPLLVNGWLQAVAGDDARQRPVRATAAGRRTLARAVPLWRQAQDDIDALLGERGTQRLHAQVDRALARLQEPA
jgi:DNA-binding MarR family transcriptional regulator